MLALLSRLSPRVVRSSSAASQYARGCSTTPLEYASSCFIPTTWLPLPLLARKSVNHDTSVLEFGLPEGQSLDLPACACILLRAPGRGAGGEDAVRPYTPISDNATTGKFSLLIKRYADGAASQWLQGLDIGETVDFKHIKFNLKAQYPFDGTDTLTFVCAGTGITPMYQALGKLLNTPGDSRKAVLLYGNKSVDDILLKDELDAMAAAHPERLKVVHVIGTSHDSPAPPGWSDTPTYVAETGWVDEAKIRKYAFAPRADTLLFVCGLPGMYDALCGPRTEPELADGSVLQRLGYTKEMVAKM